jgi:SP family general alpha glucoside:H+ symporter-like MFS transporter
VIAHELITSIMEGFDLVLLSSLFAQPQFQRKYGVQLADGSYTIESRWQIGLNLAVQAGSIIGLLGNGWASERFGYRKTILGAVSPISPDKWHAYAQLVMMIAVIFIPFFAQNIQTLFAGQLLAGIPWGIFQTLTTAVSTPAVWKGLADEQYASEVVPVALRPYLTAYVNLCWVIGQLIASGVLRGVLDWQSEWAFRVPFALQCMSLSTYTY